MSKTYIQLGKIGDILNILPLLYADAQKGQRNRLMVAKDYASILEGCSYLEPVIFPGKHWEIGNAVEQAKKLGDWVCTQVNGPREAVAEFVWKPAGVTANTAPSFNQDSWRMAGRLNDWLKNLPLVFDKRDPKLESEVLKKHFNQDKKNILLNTGSVSSPFPYRKLLAEILQFAGDQYHVIDLGTVTALRFFDLLSLYEKAYCLITVDSAPLHLARAVPALPVFAITNDSPKLWNGSAWLPQHLWYCRYQDFPNRACEMLTKLFCLKYRAYADAKFFHVWNEYEKAGATPMEQPQIVRLPIYPGSCGRDSANTIADPVRNPYLRDVLQMAMQRARNPSDIICLTRPDTVLHHPLHKEHSEFVQYVAENCPCYAYRWTLKPDRTYTYQPIIDAFAATREWWKARLKEIPEMVLNADFFWSHGLWAVFRKHGAKDVTGICERYATPPRAGAAEFPPAVKLNSQLSNDYILTNKIRGRFPRVSEQHETIVLKQGIFDHAYNPSIVRIKEDFFRLAYRYHPDPLKLNTRIAWACLDDNLKVIVNTPLDLFGKSTEDPRFFWGVDQSLFLSYVNSDWPEKFASRMQVTRLSDEGAGASTAPEIGKNDGSSTEKNWIFFSDFCIYSTSPAYIVHQLDGGKSVRKFEGEAPSWPYGPIRGGTAPLEYDGNLIRFFHSGADNEFGDQKRRYFVGAMITEKKWPFKVRKISRVPIIFGSEEDDYKPKERAAIRHWKKNVIFPGGAIPWKNGFLLSVGINDSACALVKLDVKNLNL